MMSYDSYLHKTSKVVHRNNKMMAKKRSVKITYISSPMLVRACDASEFRSVVQQLTGKDSNNKVVGDPHTRYSSTLMHQSGNILHASQDYANGFCHYNNRSMTTDELFNEEDYFWKELASSVMLSPCVLV
ncbi:hypothetical protein Fmac_007098 [Flemingia macrophylla]|uniref:VQ domain-containing protein n=1 Tax=Flemingia macrophylla TaxID=520843 RepID=A0ABD1NE10_9FABA